MIEGNNNNKYGLDEREMSILSQQAEQIVGVSLQGLIEAHKDLAKIKSLNRTTLRRGKNVQLIFEVEGVTNAAVVSKEVALILLKAVKHEMPEPAKRIYTPGAVIIGGRGIKRHGQD